MAPTPVVLGFPAVKTREERVRVIGEDGELVATLSPATRRYRFEAHDAQGEPLCSGGVRAMIGWVVHDPAGTPLARMGPGLFGRYSVILRGGDLKLALRGRAHRGDLRAMTADEQFLLNSVPSHSAWAFGDEDWLIRSDGTLTLAEVVAIMELHRLEMRRRRRPTRRQRLKRRTRPTPRGADAG